MCELFTLTHNIDYDVLFCYLPQKYVFCSLKGFLYLITYFSLDYGTWSPTAFDRADTLCSCLPLQRMLFFNNLNQRITSKTQNTLGKSMLDLNLVLFESCTTSDCFSTFVLILYEAVDKFIIVLNRLFVWIFNTFSVEMKPDALFWCEHMLCVNNNVTNWISGNLTYHK